MDSQVLPKVMKIMKIYQSTWRPKLELYYHNRDKRH